MSETVPDIVAIQQLQFRDREAAESQVTRWFQQAVGLTVSNVELQPSAVSLNSFKGYASLHDGRRVYFKSHTESHSTQQSFYNSEEMIAAGYDIMQPIESRSALGTQVVLYAADDMELTSVFDLVQHAESTSPEDASTFASILAAERNECARLLDLYSNTGRMSPPDEFAAAPVHQLFHHRLTGKRFENYYGPGRQLTLPNDTVLPIDVFMNLHWRVNGVDLPNSLQELVVEAIAVLSPDQSGFTVIGHGDAHAGNIFVTPQQTYRYFAPAFGGRNPVLLDVVKPLYHNVFARWMYFPTEIANTLKFDWSIDDDVIDVTFDPLSDPLSNPISGPSSSPYRKELFKIKSQQLIEPLLRRLNNQDQLGAGRRMIDLGLMCCPLLTVNPGDNTKYPATVSLFGFAQAVQLGNGQWPMTRELQGRPTL